MQGTQRTKVSDLQRNSGLIGGEQLDQSVQHLHVALDFDSRQSRCWQRNNDSIPVLLEPPPPMS